MTHHTRTAGARAHELDSAPISQRPTPRYCRTLAGWIALSSYRALISSGFGREFFSGVLIFYDVPDQVGVIHEHDGGDVTGIWIEIENVGAFERYL